MAVTVWGTRTTVITTALAAHHAVVVVVVVVVVHFERMKCRFFSLSLSLSMYVFSECWLVSWFRSGG